MACSITVDLLGVSAIQDAPGQPPNTIHVSGTADGCQVVLVQLHALNSSQVVHAVVSGGVWVAEFVAPADFDPADFPCGVEDVKIDAICEGDPACQVSDAIPVINCRTKDCPPQASLIVFASGEPDNTVDPSECLPPGDYTVQVTDPVVSTALYQWSLNGTTQPAASGNGVTEFDVTVPAGGTGQSVSVIIMVSTSCLLSAAVTLTPCEDEEPRECPDSISLQVSFAGSPVADLTHCLEPGLYTVAVTDPSGANIAYSWSLDNQFQAGQTAASFDVDLAAGETKTVQVSVTQAGCPTVPGSVTLTACEKEVECPDSVSLVVINEDGRRVDPSQGCLPAGDYRVRVESPSGAGVTYVWAVNGVMQAGQSGDTLNVSLGESQGLNVSVSAVLSGCDPVPGGVALTGCGPRDDPLVDPPWWCPWVLRAGLTFLIVGLALILGGFCSGNIPVAIVGISLAAIGVGILIAWAFLCAPARGGCRILRLLIQFLSVLEIILGIVALIFGIIAAICAGIASPTGPVAIICGLPGACGIGALIDFGIVGTLLAVLALIYLNLCERRR